MSESQNSWAIIINPKSGKKRFRSQQSYLFSKLKQRHIAFSYHVTRFAGHATLIAQNLVENGCKNILVLGGDGTVSEVVNGIFSASISDTSLITLALIPRGTGNDWGRFWGLDHNHKHSIDVFLKAKKLTIDIGEIAFTVEGKSKRHFFINALGLGLDAKVVNVTHRLKEIFGSHSALYTVAMLLSVFSYKSHNTKLMSDDKHLQKRMFTMSIGNGCYSGGGLKQNPAAVPNDGWLDLMLAEQPRFSDIVGAIYYLFRSKLTQHPIVHSFTMRSIEIHTDKSTLVEADGIIVNGESPYHVRVLPASLQMIIP